MRLLLLAAWTASMAPALDLCVRNEAGLDNGTLLLTMHHIRQNPGKAGRLSFACSASAVRVTFAAHQEGPHPPDALGATRSAGGKILPDIIVFTRSVLQMLGEAGVDGQARALAKVVAHELSHYFRQQRGHDEGLDKPFLDAQELIALR
ncbi:MAG: hypothetical protein JNK48_08220 [Bryobacterales bacterium]|nr:hypothetical protein [Bryobacterales bacterium]